MRDSFKGYTKEILTADDTGEVFADFFPRLRLEEVNVVHGREEVTVETIFSRNVHTHKSETKTRK